MEQKVITPTVGRKVWFYPLPADTRDATAPASLSQGGGTLWKYGEQPMDATLVFVHGDRLVNLAIFDHAGMHHVWPQVKLLQPGDPIPTGTRYCTWMPYQVGQAEKTAQAERSARRDEAVEAGSVGAPLPPRKKAE